MVRATKYLEILVLFHIFDYSMAFSGQNPKIFVDVNCIETVRSIAEGFQVVMPSSLFLAELQPYNLPVVYVSAVPLNPESPSFRHVAFEYERIDNPFFIHGLKGNEWYFVCVEFENQHRFERRGNFSTSCKLQKTLPTIPTDGLSKMDSVIQKAKAVAASDDHLEFQVEVKTDFPTKIDFYLENDPKVQSFIISRPSTLRLIFAELTPNFNHGSLCTRFQPLSTGYTAMGRHIQTGTTECYLRDLTTTSTRKTEAKAIADMDVKSKLKTLKPPTPLKLSAQNFASTTVVESSLLSLFLLCILLFVARC